MYYFLTSRERLVQCLPTEATAGEIGVAHGDFAEHIINSVQPKRLHLIDPWSHLEAIAAQDPTFLYGLPPQKASEPVPENIQGEEMYNNVIKRLGNKPGVELHRQFSYKLAPYFANDYFDFLYIDGNHNYEFVLNDLLLFAPKVKEDGLILGHDFFEDSFAADNQYGVIDAVNSFLKRSDFRLIGLTSDFFSTFVLARELKGFAARFITNCLESDFEIIELPPEIAFNYYDNNIKLNNGTTRRIPSFSSRRLK